MVSLKGTKEGLLITLGDGDWRELLAELSGKLERPRAAEFFRGAYAKVESQGRTLTDFQTQELDSLLQAHGMQVDRRKYPGLPVQVPSPTPLAAEQETVEAEPESLPVEENRGVVADDYAVTYSESSFRDDNERELWTEAAMVRRTIRSGQRIRYPGHVVVYGDVNPGGEIIAGGDVIVWGKLHGLVHAGATGDDRAIVGALLLAAMQLRIGNHIARAPDQRMQKGRGVEIARVRNGRIVIETWMPRRDWRESKDWLQALMSKRGWRILRK